jgi:hypothetical protein
LKWTSIDFSLRRLSSFSTCAKRTAGAARHSSKRAVRLAASLSGHLLGRWYRLRHDLFRLTDEEVVRDGQHEWPFRAVVGQSKHTASPFQEVVRLHVPAKLPFQDAPEAAALILQLLGSLATQEQRAPRITFFRG